MNVINLKEFTSSISQQNKHLHLQSISQAYGAHMSHSIPHYFITPFLLGLTLNIGCDDTAKEADCGGNGEMHGDHCDCDAGYSPSEDGLSCELSDEEDVVDYGGDFEFNPSDIQVQQEKVVVRKAGCLRQLKVT